MNPQMGQQQLRRPRHCAQRVGGAGAPRALPSHATPPRTAPPERAAQVYEGGGEIHHRFMARQTAERVHRPLLYHPNKTDQTSLSALIKTSSWGNSPEGQASWGLLPGQSPLPCSDSAPWWQCLVGRTARQEAAQDRKRLTHPWEQVPCPDPARSLILQGVGFAAAVVL